MDDQDESFLDAFSQVSDFSNGLIAKRSDSWRHFEQVNEKQALCKHCKNLISHSGNTTNLTRHFKKKHPNVIEPDPKQPSATTFTCSNSRQNEINQDIAEWIALDGLPLNTIESKRFRLILTKYIPGYKPVCRKTLYTKYILPLYKRTFLKMKDVFKDTWYSLTTDGWKARTT